MTRPVRGTRLIRFLAVNAAAGIAAGWLVCAMVLLSDLGHLGSLAASTDGGALARFVLFAMFGLTYGSLAMGIAIWSLGELPAGRLGPIGRFYRRMADHAYLGDRDH